MARQQNLKAPSTHPQLKNLDIALAWKERRPMMNRSREQEEQNRNRTHTDKRHEGDNGAAEKGISIVLERKDCHENSRRYRQRQDTDLHLLIFH
jgi:hypothetical protein